MRRAVRAIVVKDDKLLVMRRNKFGQEYYILVGGGIDAGETPEQALSRELMEETGFTLVSSRLVFTESHQDIYGHQYIYACEVTGDGTPVLHPSSDEAQIHALGQNLYEPLWLPIKDLAGIPFRTPELQQALVLGLRHGFPKGPVELDGQYLEHIHSKVKKG